MAKIKNFQVRRLEIKQRAQRGMTFANILEIKQRAQRGMTFHSDLYFCYGSQKTGRIVFL